MSEIDFSLLNDFLIEAAEHLEEMENNLLKLEVGADNQAAYADIFRPIHTIKGASQFVGLDQVSTLAHRLEDMLDLLRNGDMETTQPVVDVLMEGRDRIQTLAKELETNQSEDSPVDDLVAKVSALLEGPDGPGGEAGPEAEASLEPEMSDQETEEAWPDEAQAQEWGADEFEFEDAALDEAEGDGDDFQPPPEILAAMQAAEGAADAGDDADFDSDPQPQPPAEAADQGLAAAIQEQASEEEEYDEELYAIFLEQLRRHADLVRMLAHAMQGSGEAADLLADCQGHLLKLRSAANYMGYDHLVALYDAWVDEVDSAFNASASDNAADTAFMLQRLATLYQAFPQLGPLETLAPSEVDEAEPGPAPFGDDAGEALDLDPEEVHDFINEAIEHLEGIETALIRLETDPTDKGLVDEVFRGVHTIKGAAQFVGLQRTSAVSHGMEDLLMQIRKGARPSDEGVVEALILGKDRLNDLIEDLEHAQHEEVGVDDVLAQLEGLAFGGETPTESERPPVPPLPGAGGEPVVYEEEYDQELYRIFTDQLVNFIARIRYESQLYAGATEPLPHLHRVYRLVRRLEFSANYMGYGELQVVYDSWLSRLQEAEAPAQAGTLTDLAFNEGFITRVMGFFPQLAEQLEAAEPPSDEAPMAAPAAPPPSAVAEAAQEAPQPAAEAPSEDELFVRLTEALESGDSEQDQAGYETLHSVFEEMLSPREQAAAAQAPEPPAPAALRKPQAAPKAAPKAAEAKPRAAKPAPKPAEIESPVETAAQQPAAPAPQKATGGGGDRQDDGKSAPAAGKPDRAFKKSVRVDADKIDALMNQVGELIVDRSYFFQIYNEMHNLQVHLKEELGIDPRELKQVRTFSYRLGEAISSLSRTSNELQESVMKVRMLPISQLFNRYPRLIHDLTHRTDKKINLVIKGEETELDKMIVEELSDPLIHVIRNAVDHGIETVAERKRAGKPDQGTLVVEAYQESNHIVIEVTDDGRGMDPERLKAKALERKMFNKDELDRMSLRDLNRLIMNAGFSTAETVTRTSGRGVGMDVVKKNIEKLNGTIEVDSRVGMETQIRLKIPLTLAIIPALLVRVGQDSFTIPLSNVEETLRIFEADTTTIEGAEVVHLRGRTMPVFRLSTLFNLPSTDPDDTKSFVVVVNTGAEQVGLVVDELVGQDEVVIKPLVDYLQEKSGFSGATIIGDGRISLILDIFELVKMAGTNQSHRLQGLDRARRQRTAENRQQYRKAETKPSEKARPILH